MMLQRQSIFISEGYHFISPQIILSILLLILLPSGKLQNTYNKQQRNIANYYFNVLITMITSDVQVFYQYINKQGPIMGVDFGMKKLGFAISNKELTIALPLTVEESSIDKASIFIAKHAPSGIVVGMPFNMDGSVGSQVSIVKNFTNKLFEKLDLPFLMQDERMTSRAANNLLRESGIKRKKRDKIDDAIAACMILDAAMNTMRLLRNA